MGYSFRRHLTRLRATDADRDAGMTLIELLFAMVIFALVAGGAVAGLTAAMKTTRLDRNRVAASALAARELEIVRNVFKAGPTGPATVTATMDVTDGNPLSGGTVGAPLVVDNTQYTVVRNAEWLPTGAGKSACDGGSTISYPSLAVKVTVSWPNMGNVSPVESDTILTPAKGTLSSGLGFVAVKVLNATGNLSQNQQVSLTGPGGTFTDTTSNDGCAVFAVGTAGNYTATASTSGFVDFYGNPVASKSVVVSPATMSQVQISYDQSAELDVTETTQAGYALPTETVPVTLANTGLQPLGFKTFPSTGATTQIKGLWPFVTDGYTSWAGTCTQNDPAASGGTRNAATIVNPGQAGATTLTLAPVTVQVTRALLPVPSGATVLAVPALTAGCTTELPNLTLGTINAAGVLKTSLPAGKWTIQLQGYTASGAWPSTAMLLPTSGPTSVTAAIL
jgi:prepilin-type N-terminal cleavage/methylation domain-containing protein